MARTAEAEGDDLPVQFSLGGAVVDRRKFTVSINGQTHPLTARELKLAEIFARRKGDVVTRDVLLDEAWGVNYAGTTRTLDQHIAQLRKKISATDGSDPITTVHGVGYRCD